MDPKPDPISNESENTMSSTATGTMHTLSTAPTGSTVGTQHDEAPQSAAKNEVPETPAEEMKTDEGDGMNS